MSKKNYPKYVKATGETLRYQRAIPRKLLHVSHKQLWTTPLGLTVAASESEVAVAWAEANKSFELHCRTLENSSPAAYTENELDRLAEDILRRKGLKSGQFADVLRPEITAQEEAAQQQFQAHSYNYADHVIPEFDDIVDDLNRENRQPTVQEEAVLRAWKAVQTRQKKKPRTLNSLWEAYLLNRSVNVLTRDGKRIQGRWDNVIGFVKDTVVTPDTPDHIESGIDEYVEHELDRGIAPTSIYRNLREPLACFKWANRHYRLKWRSIEIQPMRKHKSKSKLPLTYDAQFTLVEACLQKSDWVSGALLLMLQGGCMPSEVARLRPDQDLNLNAKTPYVIISGGDESQTKQEARKRIVPIVFGVELMMQVLPTAIERLGGVKEPSATITNRLKTVVGSQYSSHCLRHTFRSNGLSVAANPMHLQAIGGWTGGNVNKVMLEYGSAGLEQSEVLLKLYEASQQIHRHILGYLGRQSDSNVVPIRG